MGKCNSCRWFGKVEEAPATEGICWRYGGVQLHSRRDGCRAFEAMPLPPAPEGER